MSQHQTRPERDLYDHEDEQRGPSGRRRGPVADWGVGEELFDQMPRRRFNRGEERGRPIRERRAGEPSERSAEGGDVPRGRVDDGRRTLRLGSDDDLPSDIAAVTADRDLGDVDPGDVGADLEGPHDAATAPEHLDPAPEPAAVEDGLDPGTAAARTAPRDPARRTVKIEGRPEGALPGARFHEGSRRGRAGRSVNDRVGARPDRLAAWAFALGVLLILIAVLSSVL